MKLLIAGSRSINEFDLEKYVPRETTMIITGGAYGIDVLAERIADKKRLSKLVLRPRYDLYGKAAPIKRNQEIHRRRWKPVNFRRSGMPRQYESNHGRIRSRIYARSSDDQQS